MQNWVFDIRSRKFFLLLVFFIVLTCLVYAKITRPFDDAIVTYVQLLGGNHALDLAMEIFSEISDIHPPFYMPIFAIILILKKSTRRLGLVLLLSLVVGTIAALTMKPLVGADRPELDFLGTPFPISLGKDPFGFGSGSFPSGHATRTAAFAFVIGFALSERFPRGCYLLWIFPLLVSISRVFILEHFPMDVIGGTVLGILIADIVSKKLKLHLIFEKSKA